MTLIRAVKGETPFSDVYSEGFSGQGQGIEVVLGGDVLSQEGNVGSSARAKEQLVDGVRNFGGQRPDLGFRESLAPVLLHYAV